MPISTTRRLMTGGWGSPKLDLKDPSLVFYTPLWYPDSETTGTTIISKDKNRHTCTVTGATWGSQGRTFDKINDIIVIPPNSAINNLTSGLTSIVWIKPTTLGESTTTQILNKSSNATPTGGWMLYMAEVVGGQPTLAFRADHATTDIRRGAANNFLSYGSWQMITMTWTGGAAATNVLFYKNAVESSSYQLATNAVGDYSADTALNLNVGNEPGTTQTFDGIIGDVFVYNKVISLSEIKNIYQSTKWRYL